MNSFVVYFSISFLINEFADNFFGWFAPSDIVFDCLEDGQYNFSDFNKNGGVNLSETQLVENDFLLSGDILDTSDSDNDQQFSVGLGSRVVFLCCVYFFILNKDRNT